MAWKKRSYGKPKKKKKAPEDIKLLDVEVKAMHLLSMRDHATEELRKKLRDRKYQYPEQFIDETIDRMTSFGYLDDERVSQVMTRMLIRQRWGPYQIRNKLRAKGFSNKHIEMALSELVQENTWLDAATERVESKFRMEIDEMDRAQKQKVYKHLQYRGFPGDVIRSILF